MVKDASVLFLLASYSSPSLETDSCEFSTLCTDIVKATEFRSETINYINKSLGTSYDPKPVEAPSNAIIPMFGEIGERFRQSSSPAQVQTLSKELKFFINMTDVEQRSELSGKLPTVEEYQKRRMGSSGVGVCVAFTQYCYGMDIPASVMHEEEMQVLWDETNAIISTTNDILSIKKEIAQQQVDSLIPLLTERHGSVQTAVDIAFELTIRYSYINSRSLSKDANMLALEACIGGIASLSKIFYGHYLANSLDKSLISGRYKLKVNSTQNGLKIEL
ncbi:terpene synthase protein [Rutstroemia sp. NJR-2017a WRK4]|nr:terpene synthase protein [Rutstroemia sp. NJR-2017a WRK4]